MEMPIFGQRSGFEQFQNEQTYKMQLYKHAYNKDKEKVVKSWNPLKSMNTSNLCRLGSSKTEPS
jgi:hypothetical protein